MKARRSSSFKASCPVFGLRAAGVPAIRSRDAAAVNPAPPAKALADTSGTVHVYGALVLEPNTTPLSDLAFTPWACWHGSFGHASTGRLFPQLSYYLDDAPLSPLWQAPNSGACDHVLLPPDRSNDGEEVLDDATAGTLRGAAGELKGFFDKCRDWRQSPSAGVYVEVCDQGALDRFFASGLTKPDSGGLRVTVDRKVAAATAPVVYRDANASCFDSVAISSVANSRPEIYAGCVFGKT